MHYRSLRPLAIAAALLALALPGAATAEKAFGTKSEARSMADDLIGFIQANSIERAAKMLRREDNRFGSSKMGVALIEVRDGRLIVVGHSRFPTLKEADFTDQQDLRGNYLIREFHQAAKNGGGFVDNYYPHYDTKNEYHYRCLAEWAVPQQAFVTVCI